MLSLDSCTLGWSNGLIPSTRPATAVAYSQARNCAPSGPVTEATGSGGVPPGGPTVTSGDVRRPRCPARSGPRPPPAAGPCRPCRSTRRSAARPSRRSRRCPSRCRAMTILSRPTVQAAPSASPRSSAGLCSVPASCRRSAAAWSSSAATSTPASAAGTSPNAVSALYRPPTSGSARNTARKPASRAVASSGEPGSVTATKCRPTSSIPAARERGPGRPAVAVGLHRAAGLGADHHDGAFQVLGERGGHLAAGRSCRARPARRRRSGRSPPAPATSRPCRPSTTRSMPSAASSARSAASRGSSSREVSRQVEPAEPDLRLRLGVRPPQRRVAGGQLGRQRPRPSRPGRRASQHGRPPASPSAAATRQIGHQTDPSPAALSESDTCLASSANESSNFFTPSSSRVCTTSS